MELCPHCGNNMKGYRICPNCGPTVCWWINHPEIVEELNVEEQYIVRDDDGELHPYGWVKAHLEHGRYHPFEWVRSIYDGKYYPWNWYRNVNDGSYRPLEY